MLPVLRWLRGWIGRPPPAWYHPDYRLPIPSMEPRTGAEPRRADFVAWHLSSTHALPYRTLRTPELIAWADVARVHSEAWLESLDRPEVVARVFGTQPWEIDHAELIRTTRLACGGTLAATRAAVSSSGPALNLLGGFHHAGPDFGGGHCPLNDIGIAVAALRHEGFSGRVAVLDMDAHPPDGTAACLVRDRDAWIGSLSGVHWAALPNVDEVVLPGADDAAYLAALDALLGRMPDAALTFVLAGGDVLAGDKLGSLALTLDGVGERDRRVYRHLQGRASVWVPGGGYHRDAWKLLARTAGLLATGRLPRIPPDADPMRVRFARIAAGIEEERLGASFDLSSEDLEEALGLPRSGAHRLLGYYTAQGIEYALHRYGFLNHCARMGYGSFHAEIDVADVGDRLRVFGECGGKDHLLLELVVARERLRGEDFLFVHWLTLRHPRAAFGADRPRLPGQEVPGLGLSREAGEMLGRMAERLGLAGVAFRPMHYHTAFSARHDFQFLDPRVQGRFEALRRDLRGLPLDQATLAVAEGRVWLDGAPYAWEPEPMAHRPGGLGRVDPAVAAERERARFTIRPGA